MILRGRLERARRFISLLREIMKRVESAEVLDEDPILRGAVERYLHLSIEALIDVGARICSLLRLGRPERYRDIAKLLGEVGALGRGEVRELELWIGLRNVLVHGYAVIDSGKLVEALQQVDELDSIVSRLERFVSERGLDPLDGLDSIVETVRRVLEGRSFVLFAYLFGSRARGEPSESSDVDVAIYTSRDVSWRELIEIKNELEDVIGISVDLVHLNTAPLTLAYEIVTTGIVVLDRDPAKRVDFEVRVVKELLDLELDTEYAASPTHGPR